MMSRFVLILTALSILNQSIDLDYLTAGFKPVTSVGYDDVDSIAEYVIEQIMDDDGYVPEDEDDHNGMPQNQGIEKFDWNPLCCIFTQKLVLTPTNNSDPSLQAAFQQARPTCKGYFNIVSPPPDVLIA